MWLCAAWENRRCCGCWSRRRGSGVPILCLDHDAAGIEATGRLKEILAERGYAETAVLQSIHKDWNEDVKARCGLEAQSAEEHPQLMAAPEVCKRVCAMSTTVKLDRLNIEVPWLIEQYRTHLHWGQFDQAMDCMEQGRRRWPLRPAAVSCGSWGWRPQRMS